MKKCALIISLALTTTLAGCQPKTEAKVVADRNPADLSGTSWQLVEFQSMDDSQGTRRPEVASKYVARFEADGRFAAQLDCNRGTGSWKSGNISESGGSLEIGPLAVTGTLCAGPSMGEFLGMQLAYVRSFTLRDGRLNMALMADGGIIVWEPASADN